MYFLTPKYRIICLFILLFTTVKTLAHGDLIARINAKTHQISKDPQNAELYYDRGFLYQQHEEYDKALKDYSKAEKLGYNTKLLFYRLAETYKVSGKLNKALQSVSEYLERDQSDIKIYKLKAQILILKKQYPQAITAYKYVLKNTIDLRPDDFITYCDIVLKIDSKNYKEALDILEVGFEKLGENNLTLRLKKIEYLTAIGDKKEVIDQYNYFIQNTTRKEKWYYQKACYLSKKNDKTAANIALQQAKLSLQRLNPRFQQTPDMKILAKDINKLEKKL